MEGSEHVTTTNVENKLYMGEVDFPNEGEDEDDEDNGNHLYLSSSCNFCHIL